MTNNLAKVLNVEKVGELVSATFKFNKKTGAAIAQATWKGGKTVIKTVTKNGAKLTSVIETPAITSTTQRNGLLMDLLELGLTQTQAAAHLNISQSTASRVFRKLSKK